MKITLNGWMNLFSAVLIGIAAMFWFASCDSVDRRDVSSATVLPDVTQPRENITDSAESVGKVAGEVGASATKIDSHTTAIESATPVENRPIIKPDIDGIRTETAGLRGNQAELLAAQQKLIDTEAALKVEADKIKKLTSDVVSAQAENVTLKETIIRLENESTAKFNNMMAYLGATCAVGLGISLVVAFFGRSKMAIMIAVGFAVTLAIAAAVSLYLKTIALVTICIIGAAFLGVIGYLAWQALKSKKIEEELVHSGELTKQYLPPEAREHIFGYGAEPGKIDQIQTKATKERVKKIREYSSKKQNIKLAPKQPEYWRPPLSVSKAAFGGVYGASEVYRDTII